MILDKIIKSKKEEVAKSKSKLPLDSFKSKLTLSKRDFKKAISTSNLNLIAEIKRKSPSQGIINTNFNFKDIASIYDNNKHVKAISVLTDSPFFQGNLSHLSEAEDLTKKPLLRKDFILDEYQVYESRLYGADALLLIARILTKEQIKKFIDIAKNYNMDCLVEIHNETEIEKLPDNVELIGINNRDLDKLEINLETTAKLSKIIKEKFKNSIKDIIIISESGIHTQKDIRKVEDFADSILIGTSLIKSQDINEKINSFFRPKIKICGITNLEDAILASDLGADYLGFIFYDKSPRYIDEKTASGVINNIKKSNKSIKFIGVFVNEDINKIKTIKKLCNLDFIQLHGDETDDFIEALAKHLIGLFYQE